MKILISSVLALFLLGCSGENKQETKEVIAEKKESVAQSAEEVKEEVATKVEEVKEAVVETAEQVKEEVTTKVEEAKEVVTAKVEEAETAIAEAQVDGAKLYQVCAGCHGADGSKAALGKSQIIQGWDAKKTADALNGYKAGTYGGAMKGIMVGQVSKLGDAEIQALSEHISKL
ncbi:c-type cytochrome [Sulfurimonas crateris]|uniref:C-type cytochrome n=1 Tax=Sulfurimonas crateris TaxID=2574727 RepID=A0A4U2Z858_9BACT|nr:c-type cytochrome [Sulfurimonas crateris]